MATLKIHCFGRLSFVWKGQLLQDLKSRKGLALLCYLAVTQNTHSRSSLAGLLWADMPEPDARMNLRKTLNRLGPLRSFLSITRDTLGINPSTGVWVDVKEFEAAAATRMDIQRLRYAVSLYEGDFLEGFESDDLPLFDQWIQVQRGRLRKTAFEILFILIAHFTNQQAYTAAIHYANHLLKLEPWHEETHRTLMRLLVASGQRSAAIKQYETCRQILSEELAVEPGAETIRLYDAIKSGKFFEAEIVATPAIPNQPPETLWSLPLQPAPLVGRASERAELKSYLAEPFIRLVSIVGIGGMGKTHLAIATAHELAGERNLFDGVVFVPLGQIHTHQQMIIALADQINIKLAGTKDPEKLLLEHLQGRQILIILDNFEHLLSEVDFVERILAASPTLKLLITSRERLKLRQEWVLDLQGLSYPEDEADTQADQTEAVALFTQRAQALRRDFSLEKNIKAVTQICKFVQGMPLALELAASRIRVLTADEIADQISHNLNSISTNLRDIPERHRTMQAVFDSSWHGLSPEEQSVMAKLSVFKGGFTLQAAEQVAGASVPILSELVDKLFVSRKHKTQDVTRYEVHELICQYSFVRLRESGLVEESHLRHLGYFLKLAEQAERFWDTPEEKEWLQLLEAERGNLHAALQYALDRKRADLLLRLNSTLFTFWIYKSPAKEAEHWLESALALVWDKTDPTVMHSRAKVLNVAGYAAITSANYKHAGVLFQEGLVLYESLEDPHGIAWSLRGYGYAAMCRGDYAIAQSFVERSLLICQESGDEWGLIWSRYDLAYLKMVNGEIEEAKKQMEECLDQFRLAGIRFGEYRALIALGYIHYLQKRWRQAAASYQEAYYLQQNNYFFQFMAELLEGLAYVAAASGKHRIAVQLLGASQNVRDSTGFTRHKHYREVYQRNLDLLQDSFSKVDYNRLWQEGYTMSRQAALMDGLVKRLA